MECSIGYSFDGKEVFIEKVVFEGTDMVNVINYIKEIIKENHKGKSFESLQGLSILIKD